MADCEIEKQFEALLDQPVESDEYWLAVGKIRTAGIACAWNYILRQCKSDNPEIRLRAVDVLAQMEGRDETETVTVLLQVLTNENDLGVIRSCIYALGHQYYHKNSFYMAIERFADFDHEDIRHAVAFALPNSNSTNEAVNLLIKLMTDDAAKVRDWATFGLGDILKEDSPIIRDALADRLTDNDSDVVFEALKGLALRNDLRALPPLLDDLDSRQLTYGAADAANALLGISEAPASWGAEEYAEALRIKYPQFN